MAILTPANFRPETTDEACIGYELTGDEASDAQLTAGIARFTKVLEDRTGDQFSSASETLECDVFYPSESLLLPKRCTAVTTVKTRYYDGTLTTQSATIYRLRSSLNATGDARLRAQDSWDSIDLVPYTAGLAGVLTGGDYDLWTWPYGTHTVQVAGTFGWVTPPTPAKEALAALCWDHFKNIRGDLGRAQRIQAGGADITFTPDNESGSTGIPVVDDFIEEYRYGIFAGVF